MTTGRTLNKYARVYISGYDLSGHARSIGDLAWEFETGVDDPMNASIKGAWMGQANISPGTLNGIFDTTALTGIHALLSPVPSKRTVLIAQGIRAAPADYDPCFGGQFMTTGYSAKPDATPVTASFKFGATHGASSNPLYASPWGVLLHALLAATGSNTAIGLDQGLTSTNRGGFMVYQVTTAAGAGDITATLKAQDSDTNVNEDFDTLISTGVINCGAAGVAVPTSGIVALSATATVRRYVRWQILLGTATSVTFALGFFRNYIGATIVP